MNTFGLPSHLQFAPVQSRTIVVREPSGLLRDALPGERGRMNRMYFARPHGDVELPKLFFQPYLQRLFELRRYAHVLDYACYLMEPNDPTYVRVSDCTA